MADTIWRNRRRALAGEYAETPIQKQIGCAQKECVREIVRTLMILYILQHIPSDAIIQNDIHLLFRLEVLVHFDNVGMVRLLHDLHLVQQAHFAPRSVQQPRPRVAINLFQRELFGRLAILHQPAHSE